MNFNKNGFYLLNKNDEKYGVFIVTFKIGFCQCTKTPSKMHIFALIKTGC